MKQVFHSKATRYKLLDNVNTLSWPNWGCLRCWVNYGYLFNYFQVHTIEQSNQIETFFEFYTLLFQWSLDLYKSLPFSLQRYYNNRINQILIFFNLIIIKYFCFIKTLIFFNLIKIFKFMRNLKFNLSFIIIHVKTHKQ